MSYSLYVVHMSFLLFLRAAMIDGPPWRVELWTILLAILITGVVAAYAGVVWFLTESRTAQVRRFVANRLFHSGRTVERQPLSGAHA